MTTGDLYLHGTNSFLVYEHFSDIMSSTTRRRDDEVSDKIGTVKLPHVVI